VLVNPNFQSNYDTAMTSLLGMITIGDAVYNYNRSSNPIAQGTPVTRRFAENSYEMYAQDTWKVKSNLTLTLACATRCFHLPGKPMACRWERLSALARGSTIIAWAWRRGFLRTSKR